MTNYQKRINLRYIFAFLILLLSIASSNAREVSGVWGFAVGSTQGTYFREILNAANRNQTEFKFVFENIQGAGGEIATTHVLRDDRLNILAHSAAFYIRPNLYKTMYSTDNFTPLIIMGNSPAVLLSNNKTITEVLQKKVISIGTAGAGSSTHLMAEAFATELRSKGKEVLIVHYKNTIESFSSLLGNHIDLTFEFLGDAISRSPSNIKFLGLTGTVEHNNIPLLKNIGFSELEKLDGLFVVFVKNTIDKDIQHRLRKILLEAETSDAVQRLYKADFVTKPNVYSESSLINWHQLMKMLYKTLTKDIKIE
jgi:tripartite-type tricarboxylate transporter receptor subunit TctC